MRTEWHNAPDFAEVAEALGVNTVDVLAVMVDSVVLYTPAPDDDDPLIWRTEMGRDADGILRAGLPRIMCSTSEFHDRMKALIDETMKEEE